ncbi:bifunctional phosphopantothenoylcysteine decarboxylase/phosphopantothenate--cysteine ligase CoaBC [Emcibacter nanhaiensis]|uniref:Coenzyme A biosynthesis bifunctional protein CoaBC n=1 Tax=Emcibacter nanhaiensis TaxID=1505037 RepID=A0A501PN04_9PROT|nr:bifunctional phosphopantothenoylcysteine decarboxylase/phosphopantothenate--cysteine ligase CoaBC [Emcibacter nanhaiensis]TPD61492.1 bifunctional phosphopantothenoylcysteine decarboxylase/phosphopantothenate--cysteine ligase CoaBC [Emcibacter nanhaiensis]
MTDILTNKRLLLIIGGGIAAYKVLELIRRLKERGVRIRPVLTKGGAQFVTPLSVSALAEEKVYQNLFSLTDEAEMGHIRLSRETDLVLVAPATADLMAKMAAGIADDLATTALLATDKPVLIAPSMNTKMWEHPATQRNLKQLQEDGIKVIAPGAGDLACGEVGAGRLAEVPDMVRAVEEFFESRRAGSALSGKHVIVTAGPTHEPIDPVRYIANRSSGKQGYALAAALAGLGARVTLVSGPTALDCPDGVERIDVESARDMLAAVEGALPADAAVCVAAVADWRSEGVAGQKIKKQKDGLPDLHLVENPDILKTLSALKESRPDLVVGFAAETENVTEHARAKRERKDCDWIVANDVSFGEGGSVMGGDRNAVTLITAEGEVSWPEADKEQIAAQLAAEIEKHFR